jgi:hypothetical protein
MLVYRDITVNRRPKRLWFTGRDWVESEYLAKDYSEKELSKLKVIFAFHGTKVGYAKRVSK